jgi:hypothetical protein
MRRFVLALLGVGMLSGCVARDGNKPGEAPLWYPAFVVRDANTTQGWGGQDIYGVQTNRVDPKKQPSIGAPGNELPVNPPDSTRSGITPVFNDPSRFYVAGQQVPPNQVNAQQPYGQGQRPPGSATLYPTRGNAAESVGSPTLYPPVGSFRTDPPSGASVYPNGATGERGFIGK